MFCRVKEKLSDIPRDHHWYGYENEYDFSRDLRRLHARWKGKTGEKIGEKHGFARIRFVGQYGDASCSWIPDFMLERVPEPLREVGDGDDMEELLDDIYGFDWWKEDE